MPPLRSAALALALCVAVPLSARADITAEALWALLQQRAAEGGATLTATPSRRADRLVLGHPRLAFPSGEVLLLPDVTLRETADRALAVEVPPRFPLVLDLPPHPGDPDTLTLSVSAPDLAVTLRALGPETDLSVTAQSISVSLDKLDMPFSVTAPPDLFLAAAVADLSLTWRHRLDPQADSSLAAALSMGALHAELRVDVPADRVKGSVSLDLSTLAAQVDGYLAAETMKREQELERSGAEPDLPALLALLDGGTRLSLQSTSGPMALAFDMPKSPDGPMALDISAQSGRFQAGLDRLGFGYETQIGPTSLDMHGQMPDVPVQAFSLAASGLHEKLRLGFPAPGVASPDWAMLVALGGLTISDSLWDLGDPRRVLPREPLTLSLDLSGSYTPDPRLLTPGLNWLPGPGQSPVAALTLDLGDLLLAGLGASFSGTGSVALDFTDPDPLLEGAPAARGKLSFLTTGANGLIEALHGLGVLADADMTSVRMGLLFLGRAVPGQQDQLATELDFQGHSFSLNGQKIR